MVGVEWDGLTSLVDHRDEHDCQADKDGRDGRADRMIKTGRSADLVKIDRLARWLGWTYWPKGTK